MSKKKECRLVKEITSRVLFLDMDSVIADFSASTYFKTENRIYNPPEMYKPGFFETLPVVPGAHEAVRSLIYHTDLDVHILSKPVRQSPISYSEKAAWIWKHFPELGEKVHLTQNKGFLSGKDRILVDDSLEWKEPWELMGGIFIHFDESRYDCQSYMWKEITELFLK